MSRPLGYGRHTMFVQRVLGRNDANVLSASLRLDARGGIQCEDYLVDVIGVMMLLS